MALPRVIVPPADPPSRTFVSRAGHKLDAAIVALDLNLAHLSAADLGANVGGFTDCLLQHGAARVYAVDTGYGTLAWKLRKDPRVVVMERTNALHISLPEPVNVITIDVAWTRQEKILPKAAELLAPAGRVLTLIKPHYESADALRGPKTRGVLDEAAALATLERVAEEITAAGWTVDALIQSPLRGAGGNMEFVAALRRRVSST